MDRWVLGVVLLVGVGLGLLGCAQQKGTSPKAAAPAAEEAKPAAPKPAPAAPAAVPEAPEGGAKPPATRGVFHYYREGAPPAEAKPAEKKPDEKK